MVIPARNAAATLIDTLDSVAGQTYRDFEVILVDDASTDDTAEIAASGPVPVKLIRSPRPGGPSVARNLGIAQAAGEYVAFVDADDQWHPDKLAQQVAFLDADDGLALVYTNLWNTDGRALMPIGRGARRTAQTGQVYRALFLENFVATSSVMVRRSALTEVDGFDEDLRISEDFDLWLRIASRHRFGFVDRPLTFYRIHDGGAFNDPEARLEARRRIYEKVRASRAEGSPDEAAIGRLLGQLEYGIGQVYLRRGEIAPCRRHLRAAVEAGIHPLAGRAWLLATLLPEPLLAWSRRMWSKAQSREYDMDVLRPVPSGSRSRDSGAGR